MRPGLLRTGTGAVGTAWRPWLVSSVERQPVSKNYLPLHEIWSRAHRGTLGPYDKPSAAHWRNMLFTTSSWMDRASTPELEQKIRISRIRAGQLSPRADEMITIPMPISWKAFEQAVLNLPWSGEHAEPLIGRAVNDHDRYEMPVILREPETDGPVQFLRPDRTWQPAEPNAFDLLLGDEPITRQTVEPAFTTTTGGDIRTFDPRTGQTTTHLGPQTIRIELPLGARDPRDHLPPVLNDGDQVILETPGARYTYVCRGQEWVLFNRDFWQQDGAVLTVNTTHGPHWTQPDNHGQYRVLGPEPERHDPVEEFYRAFHTADITGATITDLRVAQDGRTVRAELNIPFQAADAINLHLGGPA